MKNGTSARQIAREFYKEIHTCPYCDERHEQNRCPKCGHDAREPQPEIPWQADMTDIFSKVRYEFFGITVRQALEIMSNGDCSSNR